MLKRAAIIAASILTVLFPTATAFSAEPPPIIGGARARPKPQAPIRKADIIVEWQNVLDDCSTEKICVQGGVYNQGPQPAYNVRVRVDIGSHNLSKPRLVKNFSIDPSLMNSGDRQEFYFELNRKMPYKDRKGQAKLLEVGKFNFKVVPMWDASPAPLKVKRNR